MAEVNCFHHQLNQVLTLQSTRAPAPRYIGVRAWSRHIDGVTSALALRLERLLSRVHCSVQYSHIFLPPHLSNLLSCVAIDEPTYCQYFSNKSYASLALHGPCDPTMATLWCARTLDILLLGGILAVLLGGHGKPNRFFDFFIIILNDSW